MTIAVDLGRKATKQTNKQNSLIRIIAFILVNSVVLVVMSHSVVIHGSW